MIKILAIIMLMTGQDYWTETFSCLDKFVFNLVLTYKPFLKKITAVQLQGLIRMILIIELLPYRSIYSNVFISQIATYIFAVM